MFNLEKSLDGTFFPFELVFPLKSAHCDMYSLSYSNRSSVLRSRKPSSFICAVASMYKKIIVQKVLCLCGDENCLSYTSFGRSDVFSTSKYNRSSSSSVSLVLSAVTRTSAASGGEGGGGWGGVL